MAMLDLRRTDLRTTTLENPYWVTSAEITTACDDQEGVLISFPTEAPVFYRGLVMIQRICVEIVTGFVGGTPLLDIGSGTIPLETTTTGGTVTVVDMDGYVAVTDLTVGTPGVYWPTAADHMIVPADATVPVIYATLTSASALTAGVARVHALFNRIPLMG